MAFAGIVGGLLLVFAGIWLFAMSLLFNGLQNGLMNAVRFAGPCFTAGLAIFALSYYYARKR